MDNSYRHESAKIYAFPTRNVRAGGARRGADQVAGNRPSQPLPEVDFGSGWYHDAAVQEAARTRKP